MTTGRPPGLRWEQGLWAAGHHHVVGIDEVGRGAWAGPLTVGAVILPRDRRVYGVRDSKQLSERRREELFDRVAAWCVSWAVAHVGPVECDRLGMSAAQRVAAARALAQLDPAPDVALVDGSWNFVDDMPVHTLVKGDRISLSIAAASVLAKVSRDRLMRAHAVDHPGFYFESNKGYPCPRHRRALSGYGATAIHRRSWAFMDDLPWAGRDSVGAGGRAEIVGPSVQGTLFGSAEEMYPPRPAGPGRRWEGFGGG